MKGSKAFFYFTFILFSSFALYKSDKEEINEAEIGEALNVEEGQSESKISEIPEIKNDQQNEVEEKKAEDKKELDEIKIEDLVELLKDLSINKESFNKIDLKAIIDSQNELGESASEEEKLVIEEMSNKLMDNAPENMSLEELRLYLSGPEFGELLDKMTKNKADGAGGMEEMFKGLLGGQGGEGLEKLFAGLKGEGGEEGKEGLDKLIDGIKTKSSEDNNSANSEVINLDESNSPQTQETITETQNEATTTESVDEIVGKEGDL